MAPRSSIVWGAKDIANTGGALVSLFGEREELRKEVARLRHHVSQLAKRLHRREKELEMEKGKGRGLIIEVKATGGERVDFPGREEGARAPVEEEVAVAVVRLPSVAPSVAVSKSGGAGDMEVAEESVAEEVVEEVAVAVVAPEVRDVAVVEDSGVGKAVWVPSGPRGKRHVVAEEEVRPEPMAGSARMAATDEGVEGFGLSGLIGRSGRMLEERVGMSVEGKGDVDAGLTRRVMGLAPRGPRANWVPVDRGKKRKIEAGEWGMFNGRLVQGREIPTGPRLRTVPFRFGVDRVFGALDGIPPGVPTGPRRIGYGRPV